MKDGSRDCFDPGDGIRSETMDWTRYRWWIRSQPKHPHLPPSPLPGSYRSSMKRERCFSQRKKVCAFSDGVRGPAHGPDDLHEGRSFSTRKCADWSSFLFAPLRLIDTPNLIQPCFSSRYKSKFTLRSGNDPTLGRTIDSYSPQRPAVQGPATSVPGLESRIQWYYPVRAPSLVLRL